MSTLLSALLHPARAHAAEQLAVAAPANAAALADAPVLVDAAALPPALPDGAGAAVSQSAEALGLGADLLGGSGSIFSWGGYFQAIAVLFLMLGLLWFALSFLKRRGGLQKIGMAGRDLTVESRLSLGPKKSLIVVRFLNKRLLLGVSDQQITLLTELSDNEEPAEHTFNARSTAQSFAQTLRDCEDGDKGTP